MKYIPNIPFPSESALTSINLIPTSPGLISSQPSSYPTPTSTSNTLTPVSAGTSASCSPSGLSTYTPSFSPTKSPEVRVPRS
eukprot:891020-Amorphochlora_amoeboformis.AAC.1